MKHIVMTDAENNLTLGEMTKPLEEFAVSKNAQGIITLTPMARMTAALKIPGATSPTGGNLISITINNPSPLNNLDSRTRALLQRRGMQ